MKIPALDLAAQYKELGEAISAKINEDFGTYGLQVTKFYVENISLPPEVEAAMDKRASMGALGDANNYMQFQAADALRDAAQNEGGGAGLGAGLGAGFAVGGQMANAFGNAADNSKAVKAAAQQAQTVPCPSCGKQNAAGVKFCADCGVKNGNRQSPVRQMRRGITRRREILFGMRLDAGKTKMRQMSGGTRSGREILSRMRHENRSGGIN